MGRALLIIFVWHCTYHTFFFSNYLCLLQGLLQGYFSVLWRLSYTNRGQILAAIGVVSLGMKSVLRFYVLFI